ncbi:hypothetical protein D3C73_1622780 [compost metagenome]
MACPAEQQGEHRNQREAEDQAEGHFPVCQFATKDIPDCQTGTDQEQRPANPPVSDTGDF